MLYVPASSFTRLVGRGKRTRFTPVLPVTLKRLTRRQTGANCLTTKSTRARCGRTNVRTVVRRRFGPLVPIQVRDVCPRVTCSSDGASPPVVDPPDVDPGPAGELPLLDPDGGAARPVDAAVVGEVVELEAEGPETVGNGLWTVGVVKEGAVVLGGGGTGTDGSDDVTETIEVIVVIEVIEVMEGTGGRGRPSASACPVRRPAPSKTANAAARRISRQLFWGRSGCGV
jgi:hypothetical protein